MLGFWIGIPRVKDKTANNPTVLLKMCNYWLPKSNETDLKMCCGLLLLFVFQIFSVGEISVPSTTSFNSSIHLAWGDVSVDNTHFPRLRLKKSKTDQLGNGVGKYEGRTDSPLCPVGTGLDYMAAHSSYPGPFFRFSDGSPLRKFNKHVSYCEHWTSPMQGLLDTSLG